MPRPATLAQQSAAIAALDVAALDIAALDIAATSSAAAEITASGMPCSRIGHAEMPPLRRRSIRRFRGFTLIEMMIVVCIIALFAGLAAPSVTRLSRDQRTLKQTSLIMNTYREAESRALGRGAAVMVWYNSVGDTNSITGTPIPQWQVYESTDGSLDSAGNPTQLPFPECARTKWPPAAPQAGYGTATLLGTVGMGVSDNAVASNVQAFAYDTGNISLNAANALVCYSPKGRVFARINGAGVWSSLSHLLFKTQRVEPNGVPAGLQRGFIVNGLGISRMVEPCQIDADCSVGTCSGGVCQ